MIEKYRKRPIVVEAVEWTGDNLNEIKSFVGESLIGENYFGEKDFILTIQENISEDSWYYAEIGDKIIKDEDGDFIVMKPDVFKKKYDRCYTVDEFYVIKEKWNEENDE